MGGGGIKGGGDVGVKGIARGILGDVSSFIQLSLTYSDESFSRVYEIDEMKNQVFMYI